MFKDFMDYPWVLKPYRYDDQVMLLESLDEHVIAPAIGKANEIQERRNDFDSTWCKNCSLFNLSKLI